MSELSRFAYHILSDLKCYNCDESFDYQSIKFTPSDEKPDLEAQYQCPSCSIKYTLFVEDHGHGVSVDAYEEHQDIRGEYPPVSKFSNKPSLHRELHAARDVVEGLTEVRKALRILSTNEGRLSKSLERMRSSQGNPFSDELHKELDANVHNYLAAAYSFKEIMSVVLEQLPTGKPIESELDRFEEKHRVIGGLRIYVQHYLTLPISVNNYFHPRSEEWRYSVTVPVEAVSRIESDISPDSPDGYQKGADYHYGDVELDVIDIELYTQSHFNAAEGLFSTVSSYVKDRREEDLEDYAIKTDYEQYYDI